MPATTPPLITGPWSLADLALWKLGTPKNNLKVFSCFHCGGGSSMGYKLAGFDVIGGVEIDPKMMALYHKNVLTKDRSLSFQMPIQDFVRCEMENLPAVMYDLDILDGSPPCSSFSTAGNREDDWGKAKKFREGQSEQVLDDLFFHFIAVAKRLQPKVVIAENVSGLIKGAARGYVKQIFQALNEAGYNTQLFLFNSSSMGVPQTRERVFFISHRKDLALPKLSMQFQELPVTIAQAFGDLPAKVDEKYYLKQDLRTLKYWKKTMPGHSYVKAAEGNCYTCYKISFHKPAMTLTASGQVTHPSEPRKLTEIEFCRIQSFPDDYDFDGTSAHYTCGMSVPPFMMQRIANQIAIQWFKK